MDKIHIKDLELYCNHGVYPEETALGQKFLFDVTLYTNTRPAGLTDDLEKSINYGEISHFIKDYMKEHTYKLLEAAAENLCRELLRNTKGLQRVQLEIKKPWAPVGLPLDTVSVEIDRAWHTAYVAVGANMGNTKETVQAAIEEVGKIRDTAVIKTSSLIVTKPYGVVDQDDFLNGAMEVRTLLTPEELLASLHEIENDHGRERTLRWGPRTLDLDLLLYDDLVLDTPELNIPHIDMQNRDFVLDPMAEIAPYKLHPILKKTMKQLKGELHGEFTGFAK
jgi:dihydroneopterin aldolase/2-amino-4-hydroxy-6-hydroxymethyldihydropteridine diphosphokinase